MVISLFSAVYHQLLFFCKVCPLSAIGLILWLGIDDQCWLRTLSSAWRPVVGVFDPHSSVRSLFEYADTHEFSTVLASTEASNQVPFSTCFHGTHTLCCRSVLWFDDNIGQSRCTYRSRTVNHAKHEGRSSSCFGIADLFLSQTKESGPYAFSSAVSVTLASG